MTPQRITPNCHFSCYFTRNNQWAFGVSFSTFLCGLWPLRGYWFNITVDFGPWAAAFYLGE